MYIYNNHHPTIRGAKVLGKQIRLERISCRNSGNFVIIPMDHGVTSGPITGLQDISKTVNDVAEGGATAVLMQSGLVPAAHRGFGKDLGLIVHLSASTNLGDTEDRKVLVSTVEDSIKLGADAVSMHVNLGGPNEPEMLEDLGRVSSQCKLWGIPLLAMMYYRGFRVSNPFDVETVAHCARAAAELGADLVKVNYTGDQDSFKEVVKGATIPVVIAGGPKTDSDFEILKMVEDSINAGGRGVSMGRNIFQHENTQKITSAVSSIVLNGYSAEEAMKQLR